MPRFAIWITLGALSCSSSSATTEQQRNFTDQVGRTCLATLETTGSGTPVASQSVSCDGEGKQCSAEAQSCFQLSIDPVIDATTTTYTVRNCPACCLGTATSFLSADCSPVVCTTNADCIYSGATCQDGACTCQTAFCD